MNKIEYEKTKAKLKLLEQKGINWFLEDLNWEISGTDNLRKITEGLKNEYKEQICNYEAESKFLKQIEIKFKNNE